MARNNKIQVRRSSTPGESPSGLSAGEIAFNTNDGIIFIGKSDTDPTDILYQKFPAVSGITVDGGQVVPTTDGKITLLGGDGIGVTRDAANPDSITINATAPYSWTFQTGDPSGAGGSVPSTGSMKIKDFGTDAGFIVEFDDVDASGRDVTNFFEQLNQEYNGTLLFGIVFKNVSTQATSTYLGGGQSDTYGCGQQPFCDQTTFYALDYNPGNDTGIDFASIASPGDLVTVELVSTGSVSTDYSGGPKTGGIARSFGSSVIPTYGWTAGGAVPANDGDFGINAINQVLANATQVYFHKTDLFGYDQRDRNLDLSALRTKRGHMTLVPYTSSRGFTAGAVTFTLGGTGSYNGTYYTLDVDEVLIETGTDGITNETKFNVVLDYITDVPETEITGYVSSYNGLTGAVEGVSSVNGRTGDLDVYTGYTAQADTPASANTGDFWLETDTGDLFFYDGSAFIQISGADGVTGATGPVGDYVETFNGLTGTVDTSSLTLHVAGISSDGGITAAGEVNLLDNDLKRANLKDFSEDVNAIGTVTSNTAINFENGNVQTVTVGGNCEFSFSNPPASGKAGTVTLVITNGGAYITTFAAPVKWPGNVAPSLSSSGIDILSFLTTDGGTNIYGFVGGINFS